MATPVLDHQQVMTRIVRISWQIYEEYQDQEELIIAGIARRGYHIAGLINEKLQEISDLRTELIQIQINKDHPLESEPTLDKDSIDFNQANVVLVDDVLNSGSTLIYGVKYFLEYNLQSITTAVLVDRNHKRFPVKVDFKGLSLSTSTQDHVAVEMDNEKYSVVIS